MTPFFNPGPNPHGDAKIVLAGVGELMTEVAGEVCDGFLCHGFTTERYLREVTLPALERGAAKAGPHARRHRDLRSGVRRHRRQRGGDGALGRPAPSSRSRSTGRRPRTAACSSCTAGAACRTTSTRCPRKASGRRWASSSPTRSSTPSPWSPSPRSSRRGSTERYGDVVQRLSFYAPYKSDPERWHGVMEQLKAV